MSALDLDYYKRRLEDERHMVRAAATADVAALHEELASLYERMINALEGPEPEAT